jgi:hypothetical protein
MLSFFIFIIASMPLGLLISSYTRPPAAEKYLARNSLPEYTEPVNNSAYSYWFSFWYPLKTGRGASL